ncbi:hypothetical protein EV641_10846 [Rhodococcus sp. SMB37]|nr:hypothetical protein [Rhodococcus sp. SMB37]TCN52170.1 hypothetical protein EV641_10846 [Rhodococcus sp. SMB37]
MSPAGATARICIGWDGKWMVLDGSTDRRTADAFTADSITV